MSIDPKPLTEAELQVLETASGVYGLSPADCRRLVAEVRRLRGAAPVPTVAVETLQRLYESEINAGINWIWDGGFEWKLQVGPEAYGGNAPTVARAIEDLAVAAVAHYPDSEFARWWKVREASR